MLALKLCREESQDKGEGEMKVEERFVVAPPNDDTKGGEGATRGSIRRRVNLDL